jgi:2-polyprenyl-3-methyl-5-hydroxy-6-metoxy-1,4-benzoquinol methylase
MLHKITNPNHIKKLFNYNSYLEDIKEISLNIKDVNQFIDDFFEFDDNSDWPLAVPPILVVDNKNFDACMERAKNIIDSIIDIPLKNLNILDFGCGDETISEEMALRGANVTAYDIVQPKTLLSKPIFTSNWSDVVKNAPYDLILLYDVLDHIIDEEPSTILGRIGKLLNKKGKMVVRCHPWISRHGGHYYTHINRAWIHLFLTEEQLKKRGCEIIPNRKIVHPLYTYKKWIEEANLQIIQEDKIVENVEDYFTNNELFKKVLYKHFKDSPFDDYKQGKGDLARVMGFHFIDYILTK